LFCDLGLQVAQAIFCQRRLAGAPGSAPHLTSPASETAPSYGASYSRSPQSTGSRSQLSYVGAHAIRARLRQSQVTPLPSITSIERELRTAQMTKPRQPQAPLKVEYPHLHPTQPFQLIQVDIVPHDLPGGPCVSCFNAIDGVSRYPAG
jgi:hypothetical protein